MDDCEKFDEISLPEKEDFYSHLNMEDITAAHTKIVCKDFKIRNLGGYHDLCVQSDTLLLDDVLECIFNQLKIIYR